MLTVTIGTKLEMQNYAELSTCLSTGLHRHLRCPRCLTWHHLAEISKDSVWMQV